VFCEPKTRRNLFKSKVYKADSKPKVFGFDADVFGFDANVFGLKPEVFRLKPKVLRLKQKVFGFEVYKLLLQA
jgi:hypothetical protein